MRPTGFSLKTILSFDLNEWHNVYKHGHMGGIIIIGAENGGIKPNSNFSQGGYVHFVIILLGKA